MSEPSPSTRRAVVGLAAVLIAAAAVTMVLSRGGPLLEDGVPAPAFELVEVGGERPVSLEAHRGRVVLLDFWVTSCPPCLRQMAELDVVRRRYPEADLEILGINTEGASPAALREFLERRGGVHYPVLAGDATVSEDYRVNLLPTLYVIDREGMIRWSRAGFVPAGEIRAVLDALLEGG